MSEQFIKPCPFCNDPMLEFVQTPDGCAQGDGELWVVCDHCGAMGGTGDSVDSAIEAWNTRATQPQAPQGWKLDPVDPTKEIVRAMDQSYFDGGELRPGDIGYEIWVQTYKAAIQAAPNPETPKGQL